MACEHEELELGYDCVDKIWTGLPILVPGFALVLLNGEIDDSLLAASIRLQARLYLRQQISA